MGRRKNNHFPNLYQSHSKHPGTRIMPQKMNEVSRGHLKMLLELVVEVSYQVLARREAERKINHLEQEPFPLQCYSSKPWPLLQKDNYPHPSLFTAFSQYPWWRECHQGCFS